MASGAVAEIVTGAGNGRRRFRTGMDRFFQTSPSTRSRCRACVQVDHARRAVVARIRCPDLLFTQERLDFYRREIHYETGQLSSRTNAYLTAQSFLVIAYASSMANLNPAWGELFTLVVPALLALLGIVNSLHAWPGIQASSEIICHWQFKQSCLLHSDPEIGLAYDDSPLFSEREVNRGSFEKPCCSRDACRSCSPASGVRWACFSLWLQLAG